MYLMKEYWSGQNFYKPTAVVSELASKKGMIIRHGRGYDTDKI